MRNSIKGLYAGAAALLLLCTSGTPISGGEAMPAPERGAVDRLVFSNGAGTSPEECGACHVGMYSEFLYGFGSDLRYPGQEYKSLIENKLLSGNFVTLISPTAHAMAGLDPGMARASRLESGQTGNGRCASCHYPGLLELPAPDSVRLAKPQARPKAEEGSGVSCATCHLRPDGLIRGRRGSGAPHGSIIEPAFTTSSMCASCHGLGSPAPGSQNQTFFEWRRDYLEAGLGRSQCQECHMPRTIRKAAETFEVPERSVARHSWTGGHSAKRVASGIDLAVIQPDPARPLVIFRLSNTSAGHSVPTGSYRRALYLRAQVFEKNGRHAADRQWMFAPSYSLRPDDRAFLDEDRTRPDAFAAMRADAQGPHGPPIAAGEERVLTWSPNLKKGSYTLRVSLIYDLDRTEQNGLVADEHEFQNILLPLTVPDQPPQP